MKTNRTSLQDIVGLMFASAIKTQQRIKHAAPLIGKRFIRGATMGAALVAAMFVL